MTSLKSCFNFKLFRESFKQQKYIMILHTIMLFVVTTLPALVAKNNMDTAMSRASVDYSYMLRDIAMYLSGMNPAMMLLLTAASAVTAMWIFGYLYKRSSMQFYNSMPHTRECVYISRLLSGIAALILPLILVYAVNSVVYNAVGAAGAIEGLSMFKSFFKIVLYYCCVYSVFCFGASVAGNYFAQAVAAAFVFLVYIVSTGIFYVAVQAWFTRLSIRFYYEAAYIFPPLLLADSYGAAASVFNYVYTVIYTLVFMFLGLVLYKFRKSENTGKFFAYGAISVFLKYYTTFFAAMLAGAFMAEMSNNNPALTFFGYILGAFLCFIIVQAVFERNFKAMFSNMKRLAVYAVIICAVLAAPTVAPGLFEGNVPSADKVKEISVSANNYNGYYASYNFKDKKNIASALKLLTYKDEEDAAADADITVDPNNKLFSWTYSANGQISKKHYDEYMKNIYDTDEYKNLMLEKIKDDFSEYGWIEISKHSTTGIDKQAGSVRLNNIKAVTESLRKDYVNHSYSDIYGKSVFCVIRYNGVTFNVYDNYTDTVALVKEYFGDEITVKRENAVRVELSMYEGDICNIKGVEIPSTSDGGMRVVYETSDQNQISDIFESSFCGEKSDRVSVSVTYSDGTKNGFSADYESLPSYVKNTIEKTE